MPRPAGLAARGRPGNQGGPDVLPGGPRRPGQAQAHDPAAVYPGNGGSHDGLGGPGRCRDREQPSPALPSCALARVRRSGVLSGRPASGRPPSGPSGAKPPWPRRLAFPASATVALIAWERSLKLPSHRDPLVGMALQPHHVLARQPFAWASDRDRAKCRPAGPAEGRAHRCAEPQSQWLSLRRRL